MDRSESINELATALAKAQGRITGALKESANPFFKSKYADLASCWDACRDALSENGLAVIQTNEATDEGVTVTTLLAHCSGQFVRSALRLQPKDTTPQGIGSCITYGRRYGLTSMVGIAQVDDDGNAASQRSTEITGDLSGVDPREALRAANAMRNILNDDITEQARALEVLDFHDDIKQRAELYMAASNEMSSKERSAWKTYVKTASALAKEDKAITNVGRTATADF